MLPAVLHSHSWDLVLRKILTEKMCNTWEAHNDLIFQTGVQSYVNSVVGLKFSFLRSWIFWYHKQKPVLWVTLPWRWWCRFTEIRILIYELNSGCQNFFVSSLFFRKKWWIYPDLSTKMIWNIKKVGFSNQECVWYNWC